jgi:hypothetical protein
MTWTWATMTTWVEAKRVRVCPGPVLKMLHPRAVQRFTMQRLEKAGSAIYVLYEEKGKATWIARPQDVQPNNTIDMSKLLMHSTGIDHDAVIEFVRGIHLKLKIKCSI